MDHRWGMLEAACRNDPLLQASDLEMHRQGPSYTIDTLRSLADTTLPRQHPEFFLIVGCDAYREIDTWHRPEGLLDFANIIVTTRPGDSAAATTPAAPVAAQDRIRYDPAIACSIHNSGHRIFAFAIDGVEVSASQIRDALAISHSIDPLVPTAVSQYIHAHSLYGAYNR